MSPINYTRDMMNGSSSPTAFASHSPDTALQRLADYIETTGLVPLSLPREFFYASLPLCIIDAVFSIGVTYTSTRNTVIRFADRHGWALGPVEDRHRGEKTIADLLACYGGLSPDEAADRLYGNRQWTSTASGILKAEAVQRFARALQEAGIDDFADMIDERLADADAAIRQIPGQKSGISVDYFRMLSGDDALIKPDRMVQRYIARAIGTTPDKVDPERARTLLRGAVGELNGRGADWSPRRLDYAVWSLESGQPEA